MLKVTRDPHATDGHHRPYPRLLWFNESLRWRLFKSALGDSLFREQYLDAVACVINAQEVMGLDIVTDGDSRFDLAVGGSPGSSIRSSGSAASRDTAIPRAAGCSGTACAPGTSSGRCRRPTSPAWSGTG